VRYISLIGSSGVGTDRATITICALADPDINICRTDQRIHATYIHQIAAVS
jgi:hypothetical protein